MKRFGAMLLFIGLLSFVLPLVGMQFRLISLFGDSPMVGLLVAAVGLVLLLAGIARERAHTTAPRSPGRSPRA